jgi:type VI protein secretion system component Hcp
MSAVEYDCELKIDGLDKIGDSKRKGYEKQIKCMAQTPKIDVYMTGNAVVGAMNSRLAIDDVMLEGVCQSKGNLRQAVLGPQTKFKTATISRFAKIQGSKEEKVTQLITLSHAAFRDLVMADHSNTFSAVLTYEKIEIKDYAYKDDGTLDGSPIVSSYNRLTNEVNA